MKFVFGFRVRLGNPDLDFENLNPDFPIERTLSILAKLELQHLNTLYSFTSFCRLLAGLPNVLPFSHS